MERMKQHYLKILDRLINEYEFMQEVKNDEYADPEDILYRWENYRAASSALNIWMKAGATRLVIGADDEDYIIKIQLDVNDCEDYGAREAEICQEAKELGLLDFFANSFFLFDYTLPWGTKLPVYAMEKCSCNATQMSDDTCEYQYQKYCKERNLPDNSANRSAFFSNYCPDESTEQIEYALSRWGLDIAKEALLLNFMRDWYINDLHSGNWGYRGDMLVMIDYGGYGCTDERCIDY